MIIVDRALREREANGTPIRVALVGAGFMARGLTNQIVNSVPGCGHSVKSRSLDVDSTTALSAAIGDGTAAITEDPSVVTDAPEIDAIVEVTGAIEFAAHAVLRAIEHGKHVILMNAELDGTLGPILKCYADDAGVVLTACDGDQPGVQGNLVRFVQGLGLTPLLVGNIKGLEDHYRNPTTQEGFAARWGQNPYMVTSFADGTKISFEQATVANAFGLSVAKRGMYGHTFDGHVDDAIGLYDADELRELGGIVDYLIGAVPSPGVFCYAAHDDPKQQHYLELYKLGPGPLYSFYQPYHLCHFEVPNTVARAVLFDDGPLQPAAGVRVDVITRAKIDLPAGTTLDGFGGYHTFGVCENAPAAAAEDLVPIGLAEGCTVRHDVAKDSDLTWADLDVPAGRLADKLRGEQDARFPL